MNIILIQPQATASWDITEPRQIQHITHILQAKVGDTLKVGCLNQGRFLCQITALGGDVITVTPIRQQDTPAKIPVTLIVALPRPKVLRRIIMDSVAFGVAKIVLIHSYRVDKSYWQSPFLQQLNDYVRLGLEQSGDVILPKIEQYQRFKPFVEDVLSGWTMQQPSFVGHPYAMQGAPVGLNQPCQLIVGPEGGFIPYEIELMQKNGVQAVSLGSRILRTEMAIPVLLARLFTL